MTGASLLPTSTSRRCRRSRACKQSWLPPLPGKSKGAQEKESPGTQGMTGLLQSLNQCFSNFSLRDSDDEAEGKVPAAAKKPLTTIVNEVEAMSEDVAPEVSGENKAAAELMKIGMARNTEDSTLLMEESDETRMA